MRLKNDNVNPDGSLRLKTDFREIEKPVEEKKEKPKRTRKKKGE